MQQSPCFAPGKISGLDVDQSGEAWELNVKPSISCSFLLGTWYDENKNMISFSPLNNLNSLGLLTDIWNVRLVKWELPKEYAGKLAKPDPFLAIRKYWTCNNSRVFKCILHISILPTGTQSYYLFPISSWNRSWNSFHQPPKSWVFQKKSWVKNHPTVDRSKLGFSSLL